MRLPHLTSLALSTTTTLTLQKTARPEELAAAFALEPTWLSANPPASSFPGISLYNSTLAWLNENWSLGNKQLKGAAGGAVSFVLDPFSPVANTPTVLAVDYLKGTKGGIQFWPLPWGDVAANGTLSSGAQPRTAMLTYQVAFEDGWDFVKGGKLPGLYGGDQTNECTGGDRRYSCFSARFMWRPQGAGEVYAYVPTYDELCDQPDVLCGDNVYGISLSRGAWQFKPGGWTRVTQLIALNTPPLANGLLYTYINNTLVLAQTGLVWRADESVQLSRVLFSTFFGGSSKSYLPTKDQRAYFKGFEVWSSDLPSNTTGPVVNASIYRPADGLGDSISAATVSVTASATVYELALALLLVAALMLSA